MNYTQPAGFGKSLVLVLVAVLLASGGFGVGIADAQTLTLGSVTALPEETVELPLSLTTDAAVNELVVHISFSASQLNLLEVSLEGGVLDGVELELDDVDLGAGEITAHWILDDSEPFDPVIEAGDDLLLATLRFNVEELLLPGTEIEVEF